MRLTPSIFLLSYCAALTGGAKEISYNRDVQPILSENCFFCHGPDATSRKPDDAPLRLDLEEFAYEKREDGAQPFIPGDPENSYMIQLMESDDPHEVMPLHPSRDPAHGKVMKKEDIELVKEWIRQGAKYEPHWAYVQPIKKDLPKAGQGWNKNAVDHFIAEKHTELEISPSPQQEEHRLLRRVYFDLTGLPPTPAELDSFLKDEREFDLKYVETVDKLLSSTEYAEHMTRQWMDVSRYADTQGVHHDYHRTVWPYRDWVIDAFKQNMPFDQFTIEQLAGDLIPNATEQQKIATGYLRVLATSGEGGLIPEEYAAIYAQDRVDAMAAGWLGLTTGCASCHDHKFDQLSTKEFYELTAFFRNNTMNPMQGKDTRIPPYQFAPLRADREAYAEIQPRIKVAEANYSKAKAEQEGVFQEWRKNLASLPASTPAHTVSVNGANQFEVRYKQSAPHMAAKGNEVIEKTPTGKPAIALTKMNSYEFEHPNFNLASDKPFAFSFQVKATKPKQTTGVLFSQFDEKNGMRGWDVYIDRGKVMMHLVSKWPERAMKFGTRHALPENQWVTVTIKYNGNGKASGMSFYFNAKKEQHNNPAQDSLNKHDLRTKAKLTINGRWFGSTSLDNVSVANIKHYDGHINQVTILRDALENTPKLKIDQTFENEIKDLYFTHYNEHTKPLRHALDKVNKEFSPIKNRGGNSIIYGENTNDEPFAHILIRGQYASKGEKVYPDTPSVLPPLFQDEKGGESPPPTAIPASTEPEKPAKVANRLDLAKWLVRADNPLPARVIVNRYWSYFFGQGFLTNNADFGAMGGHPSNPALIDWLSRDLIESKWNLRHLLKTIVTSATYQQSPIASEEAKKVDPENTYLTRGPRYRLDAEQIRDLALSASGLLSKKLGGPSVNPYQPEGHWHISMFSSDTRDYVLSKGEDLYRRSMYTYWKRQATHPVMDILNVPLHLRNP